MNRCGLGRGTRLLPAIVERQSVRARPPRMPRPNDATIARLLQVRPAATRPVCGLPGHPHAALARLPSCVAQPGTPAYLSARADSPAVIATSVNQSARGHVSMLCTDRWILVPEH